MKANWHLGGAADPTPVGVLDGIDPFDEAECPVMFRPGTQFISPDASQEDLGVKLDALLRREERLDSAGITCEIKDLADVSCLACPFSKADDPDDVKCGLCRVGVQQNLVATAMVANTRFAPDGSRRQPRT